MKKTKVSIIQVCLTVLYVVSFLISNILASKQFNLFGITMTSAVLIFPITYILSDLFSEVYGYKWSRFSCYMAFACNMIMVAFFELSIVLPAGEFWGNQEAYKAILGSAPRVLFASLIAYVIGDFVNDKVFSKMKKKHEGEIKGFEFRALLSSFAGEVIDSAIFLPLAFAGLMPVNTLLIMAVTQVGLKVAYEAVILPITKIITKSVQKYEQSIQN